MSSSFFELYHRSNLKSSSNLNLFFRAGLGSVVLSVFSVTTMRSVSSGVRVESASSNLNLFFRAGLGSVVLSVFSVTTMRSVSSGVRVESAQAFVIRNKGPRVLETGLNQFDAQPLVEIFGRLNGHAVPSNADRRRAIYGRRSQRNTSHPR